MSLLSIIIEKEIRDHLFSFKFTVIFLLSTFLIILSLYTGAENYQIQFMEYTEAVEQNRQDLENDPDNFESRLTVHRQPSALSTVVSGIEGSVGRNSSFNQSETVMTNSRFSTSPIFAIFGTLDLLFIVKIVLSLAAILFSYDVISGEKEAGTLRLVASNPVPRDTILLGKCLGGFLSLVIPLLIPVLVGIIMITFLFKINFVTEDWIRLAGILLLFLVYIFVFFMAGVLVSSLTHRANISFLYLLVVWVCFVMIIPKGAVMIAEQITDVPAKHEIDEQKRVLIMNFQKEMGKIHSNQGQRKNLSDEERKKLDMERAEKTITLFEEVERQQKIIDEGYRKKLRHLVRTAMIISRISPTSSMVYSTMALGRTGISEYDRFMENLQGFRTNIFDFFKNFMKKQAESGNKGRPDLSGVPEFRYSHTPLDFSLREVILDAALLIVYGLLFFMGSFVSFLRYPVA